MKQFKRQLTLPYQATQYATYVVKVQRFVSVLNDTRDRIRKKIKNRLCQWFFFRFLDPNSSLFFRLTRPKFVANSVIFFV